MTDEPESKTKSTAKKKMHPLGCLAIGVLAVGAIVLIGSVLGNREDAKRTPCERYAKVVSERLKNCHSGVNTSLRFHVSNCNAQKVDATPECLGAIRKLECDQLEQNPAASAGAVCLGR